LPGKAPITTFTSMPAAVADALRRMSSCLPVGRIPRQPHHRRKVIEMLRMNGGVACQDS
jgi:hypothetical protein